jgi:Zn ribbon nucleic-acid-binding protein
MAIDITCPNCEESDDLRGERSDRVVHITCGACGQTWDRDLAPRCEQCGGGDLEAVVQAVVERSRGTQLSIVGTRVVHLCTACDAETLARYHRNRPNPLMPSELPTVGPEQAG